MRHLYLAVRLIVIASLIVGLTALALDAGAQTVQKDTKTKTQAKTPAKNNNKAEEVALAAQLLTRLEAYFKLEDINNSGYLEINELSAFLGTPPAGKAFLTRHDSDQDSKISREEYEAWAKEYAQREAAEMIREEEELERQIQQVQQAIAKANAQAKQQYQQQLQRLQNQRNQNRNQQNLNDRLRRLIQQARR